MTTKEAHHQSRTGGDRTTPTRHKESATCDSKAGGTCEVAHVYESTAGGLCNQMSQALQVGVRLASFQAARRTSFRVSAILTAKQLAGRFVGELPQIARRNQSPRIDAKIGRPDLFRPVWCKSSARAAAKQWERSGDRMQNSSWPAASRQKAAHKLAKLTTTCRLLLLLLAPFCLGLFFCVSSRPVVSAAACRFIYVAR